MHLEDFFSPPKSVSLALSADYVSNGFVSFSEAVLGIIPGSFSNLISLLLPSYMPDICSKFSSSQISTQGIFVCGLVPGSTAYASGKIFLGDYVMFVDGFSTSIDSFEDNVRLAENSGALSVCIVTQSLRIDKLAAYFGKSCVSDYIIHFGENAHWNGLCNSLSLFPFAMFCSGVFQESSSPSSSKALYSHPLSDKRLENALEGVIPCLLLLSDDYSKRSTINAMQIKLDKEQISVAVVTADAFGCIVLALPSRIADSKACYKALQIIVRVLLFYFGSYEKALTKNDNNDAIETDRIISVVLFEILCPELLFEELQMSPDMSWAIFQTKFMELPYLPLPETVKVSVDSLLTDFEASDFSDPFLIPPRRRYVIMGSCLFYKGFLVASHLNTTDLIDVGLFLRHRFILSALSFSPQMASTLCGSLLTSSVTAEVTSSPRGEQSVIWCEVFPTHRNRNIIDENEPCWPTFGYSEPTGARYVILVVPKKQTFIAVLLEASGLSAISSGGQMNPDSVIVREASKLLARLDGVGLLSFCEQGLSSSLGVKMVSADSAFPSASLFMQSGTRRNRSGGTALQALAVTNVKRFSSALKGFLYPRRAMSFSTERANVDSESDDSDRNIEESESKKQGIAGGIAKLAGWISSRKTGGRKKTELSRTSSYSDFTRSRNNGLELRDDFDAVHYIESRGLPHGRNRGDKVGVPGSYAGSGGTMSTSDGPGREEGIPLPLANALPTLFDMSEAHLHSGTGESSNANRAGIASPSVGVVQDILFSCPGNVFTFLFLDRNQGLYVCPSDTYSPPGSSMFHRRVCDTFLRSTVNCINMLDDADDLEETVFLFPTDPVEWFDCDSLRLNGAMKSYENKRKSLAEKCATAACSTKDRNRVNHEEETDAVSPFNLNPISGNASYWCTLRKFPKLQEKDDGANLQSSTRMFAVCGDEQACNAALDLGLQFAFDLTL